VPYEAQWRCGGNRYVVSGKRAAFLKDKQDNCFHVNFQEELLSTRTASRNNRVHFSFFSFRNIGKVDD
jgi:hypothetical protein